MNWTKEYVNSIILKTKFKEQNKIKKQLMKLINDSPGEESKMVDDYYKDNITKHDFGTAGNLELPWKQFFMKHFTPYWGNAASTLGYEQLQINKLWFQQYEKNGYHNWHTHASNYTGVYYVDLPKGSAVTQFIDPKDNKVFYHEAEEGDVIFFPCFLIHRGCQQPIKKSKTIISWNLDFLTIRRDLLYIDDKR